jgi:hypothetical protein
MQADLSNQNRLPTKSAIINRGTIMQMFLKLDTSVFGRLLSLGLLGSSGQVFDYRSIDSILLRKCCWLNNSDHG